MEEGISRRGGGGYKIIYEFKEEVPGNMKKTLPVLFLWHVMHQAIILEEERGPNIGCSDWKISRSQYRLEVKFFKYSWLHPIAAGHEEARYEEVGGLMFG